MMERAVKMVPAKMTSAKQLAQDILGSVGISLDGENPSDIQIHNDLFYERVLHEGSLGLGETYMDKWWDCKQLDVFFARVLRAKLDKHIHVPLSFKLKRLLAHIVNFQTKTRAKEVAKRHYDISNDLFKAMLDPRMIYSCGYWKDAHTLEEAQIAKLELICQKLELKKGMRLLDIGCGWGGLAKFAAEKYGVSVVGVTISKQQCDYAKDYCKGLPIDIRLQDYRDINETFDRVVSVGMFEHVGHLNYPSFMQVAHSSLADNGLFLLHTIGGNVTSLFADEWISAYIFPNGMIPSCSLITKASEKYFIMEDWHNFGADYDKTLMCWYDNFIRHWDQLKANYDERFYRMWTYYLLSCAGTFRARTNQLWQIVFSKNGIAGGYQSVR